MRSRIAVILVMAGALATAASADITLTRIATLDFNGQITGDNITSVAWDGSTAYVGTYRNSAGNVAITAADNALGSPTFRTFGDFAIGAFLGYGGLHIHNGILAATVNPNANASTNFAMYNAAAGTLIANAPAGVSTGAGGGPRTGSSWDPINNAFVFTAFGSGRHRAVAPDGSAVWTDAAGPFNFDSAWGTAWFDTDIDSAGNVYSREGFQIIKFTRTGPNTYQTPFSPAMNLLPQYNASAGDNSIGLNLQILEDFGVILWNDRLFTVNQLLENTVKAIDLDGAPVTINFANSPSDFLNNAYFDFSYDAASRTLAIAEFSSNRVYIYNVTPEPTTLSLMLLGAVGLIRRR